MQLSTCARTSCSAAYNKGIENEERNTKKSVVQWHKSIEKIEGSGFD